MLSLIPPPRPDRRASATNLTLASTAVVGSRSSSRVSLSHSIEWRVLGPVARSLAHRCLQLGERAARGLVGQAGDHVVGIGVGLLDREPLEQLGAPRDRPPRSPRAASARAGQRAERAADAARRRTAPRAAGRRRPRGGAPRPCSASISGPDPLALTRRRSAGRPTDATRACSGGRARSRSGSMRHAVGDLHEVLVAHELVGVLGDHRQRGLGGAGPALGRAQVGRGERPLDAEREERAAPSRPRLRSASGSRVRRVGRVGAGRQVGHRDVDLVASAPTRRSARPRPARRRRRRRPARPAGRSS